MSLSGPKNNHSDEIVAEINLTPLIDIMLVLLIIFMVTSSVVLESGLDIDLPKTSGQVAPTGPEGIIISLGKDGSISVQGKKTEKENLENEIKTSLTTTSDGLVIFEGDTEATLGMAVEIMDIAKKAGAKKFAIASENELK